ncbi:MAG: hypothetical protein EHM36_06705, partial [Deltaproteobacteria bacterium]
MAETIAGRPESLWNWLESETGRKWKSIGLTGLRGSSKAYVLSRWRERRKGAILVIVPDTERAEAFYDDLRFFQRNGEAPSSLFPSWETLPYDGIPPHPEIVRERVKSLFSVMRKAEAVVISPVRALMQKVLLPSDLKRSVFLFSVGEEVNRDDLVDYLRQGGYTQVRVVEERGEFSLRGAIVDIYSPFYEEPLRLEFDGDRLVSIRRFETETQRSIQDSMTKEVFLLPARDTPAGPLQEPAATFFDYWRGDGTVFVDSWEEVLKEAETFSRLVRDHYEKALTKRSLVSSPESAYLGSEEISQRLDRFQTVFLEDSPLAPPEVQQTYSFDMEANEDLRREMKASLSPEL